MTAETAALREQVFMALGKVSMCWSETPHGVFNDREARKIGDGLMIAIEEYVNAACKRDRAMQHLTHGHIIRDAQGNEIARSRGL